MSVTDQPPAAGTAAASTRMAPSASPLPPRYDAAATEGAIYDAWVASGAFTPAPEPPPGAERFVVIMPPPNVTGSLHTGHALTATVEDTLVRYHRMRGDDTLWLPGVDHASIAAQFVLDKILADEGESRETLGRERYLERMWRYMDATRDVIMRQHHKLGASADWSRNRFTMDEGSARAVRVAFKRLWDAGLVYRDETLINWCPRCRTSVSDLEVKHSQENGTLWTIRYHLQGGAEDGTGLAAPPWISIATTRPETLLGDTAVVVHPDDDRYRGYIGRTAILPFLGRLLPIISDEAVDPAFGTGAVKVTPAHDATDYEIGKRHGLPVISVLDGEARVTAEGGEFAGLDRYEARRRIVERLREMGDLERQAPHRMVVGRCDRCDTVIEPRISTQWFIRTRPLAEPALAAVREGRTRIVPDRFAKIYFHWLENIRDWNISRQLWWGHRIPAWFCVDDHITVTDAETGPDSCATCGRRAAELRQEDDIFDTWFSSGLWPFSTLGWPDATPDMARFYPTSVMETGYDILFFWVARMMMLGLFCTGVEPFHTVYLHGIVRDPYGQKMSKTKGNTVDPLEVTDEIGADALEFALLAGVGAGSDQRLTPATLHVRRNFTNKLWNAARFVISSRPPEGTEPAGEPSVPERWIRSQLAAWVTTRATRQLDELDLGAYAQELHDFVWGEYCDWFLELAKVDLRRPDTAPAERARVWRTCAETLADVLRLLHPIMPFVTERVWSALPELGATRAGEVADGLLMADRWPRPAPKGAGRERNRRFEAGDDRAAWDVERLKDLVRAIRNARTVHGIPAGRWVSLTISPAHRQRAAVMRLLPYLEQLGRVRPVTVLEGVRLTQHMTANWSDRDPHGDAPGDAISSALGRAWLSPMEDGDERRPRDGVTPEGSPQQPAATDADRSRRDHVAQGVTRLRARLGNSEFVAKAPREVVERERARLTELEEQLRQLEGRSSQ